MNINRRDVLRYSALGLGALALPGVETQAEEKKFTYKIGAWTGDLDRAKVLGLDAVQVSFGLRPRPGDLRDPDARKRLLDKSAETGVALTSLAMGEFNGNPFWEIDDAVEQVTSCIDAMAALNVKQVLMGFFGKAPLNTDEKFAETIRRYKILAPHAEDLGVVLAVEAPMNAEDHLRVVEGVDSPAVRVYYDPGNMIHLFGDTDKICDDIRKLKGLIVEAHCKDNTVLGRGRIDYAKIVQAYKDAEFFGTQVIEGSIDSKLGYDESIRQCAAYMRSL